MHECAQVNFLGVSPGEIYILRAAHLCVIDESGSVFVYAILGNIPLFSVESTDVYLPPIFQLN